MFKNAKDYDAGLLAVTTLLVDDIMGLQNTKNFNLSEKVEISEVIVSHEPYIAEAKKCVGESE